MKKVPKLILIDHNDNYLLMQRNNHPIFGNDADIPGGTQEPDEATFDTLVREVYEETGIVIEAAEQLYAGTEYSPHGNYYALYKTKLDSRPDITMSWEHTSYEWLPLAVFMEKAKNANDSYMHMVHDVLQNQRDS